MAKLDGDWIYLSEDELSNVKGISKGRQKELIHMAINEPALTEFNISSYMGHFKMIMHFKLMEKQKLMDDEIDSFATADKYEKMLIEDEFEVGLKATFYIFKDGFYVPVATSIKYILGEHMKGYSYTDEKSLYSEDYLKAMDNEFLLVFMGVQYLIHSCDDVKCIKQYKKGIKSKVVHGEMYSQPGKVLVYRLPRVTEELVEKSRKHIEMIVRHCEAWGVRGHYRHYKNGTVVYIKPYVKGINKSAYKGREYVLFKEEA